MKTETLKYIETCANEREHASVQKLSCADVRQLLRERDALLEACHMAKNLVKTARTHYPQSIRNSDTFNLELANAAIVAAISRATSQP